MRRFLLLVNNPLRLGVRQTTTMLLRAILAGGHLVHVVGVDGLVFGDKGRILARGKYLAAMDAPDRLDLVVELVQTAPWQEIAANRFDVILVRTNPGWDRSLIPLHLASLGLLRALRDEGVPVINDPDGLLRSVGKLNLIHLPISLRPAMVVSSRPGPLIDFAAARNSPTIFKPLFGTQGHDVFIVKHEQNLPQIVNVVLRGGFAVAQEWVGDVGAGDMRLVLMDGTLLEKDGHHAAIRRIPQDGDFRANLHAGGTAQPADVTADTLTLTSTVGKILFESGIRLAGLDVIDGKVIELNIHSSGGLFDARRFTGVDFAEVIIDRLASELVSENHEQNI